MNTHKKGSSSVSDPMPKADNEKSEEKTPNSPAYGMTSQNHVNRRYRAHLLFSDYALG
jgi:hypothetical protein